MSLKSQIQSISMENILVFDRARGMSIVSLQGESRHYARISNEGQSVRYLGWLEGKGSGNILMLGVLQEMIRIECETLRIHVSPGGINTIGDLERFYSQFGIQRNPKLSKESGRNMFSGNPFLSENTITVLRKTCQRLALIQQF